MPRLIDADLLKEKMQEGKIVIDEDVLKCDSIHSQLVYLLEKVDKFIEETIDDVPTAYDVEKVIEQLEERTDMAGNFFTTSKVIHINTAKKYIRNGGKE